jgi:hypothetical protein
MECAVGGVVCMARVDGVLALAAPRPDLECAFVSSVQPSCFTLYAAVHRKNGVGAAENHHGELHELVVVEAMGRGCYSQASDGNLSRHSSPGGDTSDSC